MPDDVAPFPDELEGMREIRTPEPVSYAPQTLGWWILFAVLAIGLAALAWRIRRRRRRNAYRRRAIALLDGIATEDLPALVKRTALDAWPRTDVASLSGDAWLQFLDRSYGHTGFTAGPGQVLPALAYGGVDLSARDREELVRVVRQWIEEHRA